MFPPGTRIFGRFRVTERLGSGGMGEVLAARDESRGGEEVALKILGEGARDPDALARFEREARAAARIGHPAIARVLDFSKGEGGGLPYLVLERLHGETVDDLLESGPIPEPRALSIALAVLDALAAAHAAGIVHRDVKPSNVFVCGDPASGPIKLLDFGIAKLVGDARLTASGEVLGTPLYMPPEQLRGEVVDARADVYAVGAVLYEMLSGKPIFDAPPSHLWVHVLKNDPLPLAEVAPTVSAPLAAVVARALSKDREARWPDAAAMRQALAAATPGAPAPIVARASARPRARRRITPLVVGLGLLGALVLAAALGAGLALLGSARSVR